MALTLHEQYGYSYDTMKVLLGGWAAWTAAGYPTESTDVTPGAAASATATP